MNIYDHNNIFNTSKYTNWYYSIINNALSQERKKSKNVYFEKHHILPKSLFPQFKYRKNNMVLLTTKEHFICHALLIKMTDGKNKSSMAFALCMFKVTPQNDIRYINSNIYSKLTRSAKHTEEYKSWWHKEIAPKFAGKNNPRYGAILEDSTKNLIRESQLKYMWINDSYKNFKVLKTSQLPIGYNRGRLMPWAKRASDIRHKVTH